MASVLQSPSEGSSSDPRSKARKEQIRGLLLALEHKRDGGEAVSEESLVAAHPELMPELARELEKLRRIGRALDEVEEAQCKRAMARLEGQIGEGSSVGPGRADCGDIPATIGRYQVRHILGEGTFGCVYLAWDAELRREVAIKVPHAQQVAEPRDVEAYLGEARAVARLDHPSIVPVYDVGRTSDGLCYVVSKWVRGSDLHTRLRAGRLAQEEAARLVLAIAEALHHAHRRGLVHRDIKPANILLDEGGRPYLADFGLALKDNIARPGRSFAGTPAYMSPEQARGEAHRVDGRSDIFSLGVVLYELLAGRKPFLADSREELLRQIVEVETRPPREGEPSIADELERICLKALAKRATDRYQTAEELADDLRHFLDAHNRPSRASAPGGDWPVVLPPKSAERPTPRIVPKGLRPFDAGDSDFFLHLVPGPRDREGLPESIRRWKARIEGEDPEEAFPVGVLYGPSGSGKSSLVKAGLLPRLSSRVHAIYVEAAADDAEIRVRNKLLRRYAGLPTETGLAECLAAVRGGRGPTEGDKVLLVLDQFEQWLHGRSEPDRRSLVQALRQCDGDRLQCLLLVRDDFWLALSRFTAELEVNLVQGHNTALVDLFDPDHARRVLADFGRAFGRLPEDAGRPSPAQEAFLDRAIDGLTHEGKVVPVRLALFAEMLKSKPWTPAALRDVGGAAGVGVAFLEETFNSRSANPQCRAHQRAAQLVLEALLPRTGNDMKGQVRSYPELLDLSGYGHDPRAFKELMRILDGQTRLLTPTDPEVLGAGEPASPGQRFYQLTHDYLVPALRQWLTKKQKSTLAGRSEIRLAERSAMWQARPERRQLPSLWEWMSIRLLTRSAGWTAGQQKMMRAAARHYVLVVGLLLVLGLVFLAAGLEATGVARNLLMRFRARNAAVWMALGRENAVWSLLKHDPDPTLRTQVIHEQSSILVDPPALLAQVDRQEDVSVRRAILLLSGELAGEPEKQVGAGTELRRARATLPQPEIERLLDRYRSDPDPGVHAAIEWTLRRFGKEDQLVQLERQLASAATQDDRAWYVNRQGHTMVAVPGPTQFLMGSAGAAGDGESEERLHGERIRRSFSIASKETTVEQFQRFLRDNPAAPRGPDRSASTSPDAPQSSVTWYEAAAYCNWLSQLEGIPPEQRCYLTNAAGQYAQGMTLAPNALDRHGYRLPTEAEWEYASRAGAVTSRSFGDNVAYLPFYAVYGAGSADWPQPAGRKKPNDFGLFDMLGNVAEWCQDRYLPYAQVNGPSSAADNGEVSDAADRVVRGGSFRDAADRVRCAARDRERPAQRRDTVGFRVARSYP